jgi:DNA-binding response OmpR family regulator
MVRPRRRLIWRNALSTGSPKKILVVEDDEAIRELVCLRIDIAGYQAIPVRTGLQAINYIANHKPDAMVLDIGLPTVDGFGVLKSMARQNCHIPTLMLTARNSVKDVCAALDLGASDYLSKPYDNAIFLQKLERLFSNSSRPKLDLI